MVQEHKKSSCQQQEKLNSKLAMLLKGKAGKVLAGMVWGEEGHSLTTQLSNS